METGEFIFPIGKVIKAFHNCYRQMSSPGNTSQTNTMFNEGKGTTETWLSNKPNEHSLGSLHTELIDYIERNLISSQLVSLPFD